MTNEITLRQYVGTGAMCVKDEHVSMWEKYSENPPLTLVSREDLQRFQDSSMIAGFGWQESAIVADSVHRAATTLPVNRPSTLASTVPNLIKVSLSELDAFYQAAEAATFPHCDLPAPDWWRLLLVLAYTTGRSLDALSTLWWNQINWDASRFLYRDSQTDQLDLIPLHPVALAHLRKARGISTEHKVIGCPYPMRADFYGEFHLIQKAAGIANVFMIDDLNHIAELTMEDIQPGLGAVLAQRTVRTAEEYRTPNLKRTHALAAALERFPIPDSWRLSDIIKQGDAP